MNFRDAIFEIKTNKEKELKILKTKINLLEFEIEILEIGFTQKLSEISDENKLEMVALFEDMLKTNE
jgi:hypothetical protein